MSIPQKAFLWTAISMTMFAANSIFVRLALVEGNIGAGAFSAIRVFSGAMMLLLLTLVMGRKLRGSWQGALALFGYVFFFSYAYVSLSAGIGALILFACVQMTMLGVGLFLGERLSSIQIVGVVLAFVGLGWLLLPASSLATSMAAPSLVSAGAMALAGVSWGIYSLLGRSAKDPIAETAGNFLRASPLTLVLVGIAVSVRPEAMPEQEGIVLALASGVISSGLGYTVWYLTLPMLTAIRAGIAQLTVPIIAAVGGVLFISEPVTLRLAVAGLLVLSGVGLASFGHRVTVKK